jgi:hypothetical protein
MPFNKGMKMTAAAATPQLAGRRHGRNRQIVAGFNPAKQAAEISPEDNTDICDPGTAEAVR